MFVPRTYVPKFRNFRSGMLERVSLLTNKKRYSEVCKYYEDKVLRGMAMFVWYQYHTGYTDLYLKAFNVNANGLSRKF
jgi:hypothetical protein